MDIQLPDQRPIDGINLIPIITKKGKSRGKSIGFQSNSVASLITDRYKIILKKKIILSSYSIYSMTHSKKMTLL